MRDELRLIPAGETDASVKMQALATVLHWLMVWYSLNIPVSTCSQLHNELFNDGEHHKIISMLKYSEKPGLYCKQLCSLHHKELAVCCKACFAMKCSSCPANEHCPGKQGYLMGTFTLQVACTVGC